MILGRWSLERLPRICIEDVATMEDNIKIRVNRIAITVDKKYDDVKISLYKTNDLLGTFTGDDLPDLPQFSQSGVSLKAYQAYCKDYIIELLNNDGIPGFYYEPKAEKQGVKFSPSEFKSGIKDYISDLIGDRYEFRIPMDEEIEIVEQYKDKFIKDATGRFNVKLLSEDVTFTVLGEIKSGQLCRPKKIEYNGEEYAFNITSINKIVKMS